MKKGLIYEGIFFSGWFRYGRVITGSKTYTLGHWSQGGALSGFAKNVTVDIRDNTDILSVIDEFTFIWVNGTERYRID